MKAVFWALLFVCALAVNYQTSTVESGVLRKTVSKYKIFKRALQDAPHFFVVPGLAQGFVPQGFGETKDWFLVTSYYNKYNSKKTNQSMLFVVNKKDGKLAKALVLPTTGHVGGVAGTETDVYVCCGKAVGRIAISAVKSAKNGGSIAFNKSLAMKTTCSFLSYFNSKLYAGVFDEDNKGTAYSYTIGKNSLTSKAKYVIPKKIQGMAWLSKTQVAVSQSYGRNTDSNIIIYTLKDKEYNSSVDLTKKSGKYFKKIIAPPMSENIFRSVYDGNFYAIFESGSDFYYSAPKKAKESYCKKPTDRILAIPTKKLLDL